MPGRCSNTTVSASRTACRILGLTAALLTAGTPGTADSIRVTERAALNGSRFGLELEGDGRPAGSAYIAVGPEKGFQNETLLEAAFTLAVGSRSPARNRSRTSFPTPSGEQAALSFLRFGEIDGPARVVVFLEQTAERSWFIGARTWDDAAGALVLAGRALLPGDDALSGAPGLVLQRLVIDWGAAPARSGYVRLLSERPDGVRVLLFEKTDLDNESQVVNYARVGVVADIAEGVPYVFFVDDFEVSRLLPPLP